MEAKGSVIMRYSVLALVGVALPIVASAQYQRRISGDPACTQCRIEVRKMVTIAEVPGAHVGRDSRIARDSLGRYIVVVEPGPRVAIVDDQGAFVGFVDWRSSRRDSSARGVIPIVDWDGDLHIADGLTQWVSRKSDSEVIAGPLEGFRPLGTGAQWFVVTTTPSPLPHRAFAATASWHVPTPASPPSAFQVDSVRSNDACRDCGDVVLAVTPVAFWKGHVWTAIADRYRLDLFQSWGRSIHTSIAVTNSWLTVQDSTAYPPGRRLPEVPRLTGLWFDLNGCTRPQDSWQRFQHARKPCERLLWVAGLTLADSTSRDEATRYYTMIDALGITAPNSVSDYSFTLNTRIVARTRLPGRLELFGPGALYQRRQLPDGKWVIDVYLLAVRGS